MLNSLRNLATSIKNGVEALYNQVKPTLDSIKATAVEAWELAKDLGHIVKNSFGFAKSSVQLGEQLVQATFKGAKGFTVDLVNEIAAVGENVAVSPNTPAARISKAAAEAASAQTRKDLSEAWVHATKAYHLAVEALSNAGNTAYYSGSAVYHSGTTAYYTGKTAYNTLSLGASGLKNGAEALASGAKSAANSLGYVDFTPSMIAASIPMDAIPAI